MRKRLFMLLLTLLFCGSCLVPLPAQAGFGDMTPALGGEPAGNSSPAGSGNNTAGGDTSGKDDSGKDDTGNNSAGNNSAGNGAGTENNGGEYNGANVINQLDSGAYADEKSAAQQIIDEAQQQYDGPRLYSLSLGETALIPIFSSENFSYAAYVEEEITSVYVTAQAALGNVYIDGVAGNARRIAFSGAEQTVRITVTEQGKNTVYTILLLRMPQLLPTAVTSAYITGIQLSNDDIRCDRQLTAADGDQILLTLPRSTTQKVQVSITVNTETLVYYNNIRAYNGYYYPDSGYWHWGWQHELPRQGESLLNINLVDANTKALLGAYAIRIAQPPGLQIQLQIGNGQALVNERLYTLEAPPRIVDNCTVVPLRFVAEALGATVNWHKEEQRIDMQLEGQALSLIIGQQTEGLLLAPFIESGRTMVPLRYVSEQLNCRVEWLAATREIIITR